MATYTSNINLKKPAQSDKIRIADFNTNADNIDAALGAGFGVSSAPSVNAEINSLADGLAIIANGNVHAAISSGQFVYVRGHGTLANGLYVANQNISANATLTSSNLDADSSGGLNALNANTVKTNAIKNNLTTTSSGYVLDARQGKALNDKIIQYKDYDITLSSNGWYQCSDLSGKTIVSAQILYEANPYIWAGYCTYVDGLYVYIRKGDGTSPGASKIKMRVAYV